MGTLSCTRSPIDRPTVVQAIRDLFARSPDFRDAVISDPFVGPDGTVSLDVSVGQDTVFHVVAPTADEAYALLHELVDPLIDLARRRRGMVARTRAEAGGRGGTWEALARAARPWTH